MAPVVEKLRLNEICLRIVPLSPGYSWLDHCASKNFWLVVLGVAVVEELAFDVQEQDDVEVEVVEEVYKER